MTRSISRISIWNFNVVFEPHVHTNGKSGFFLFPFFMQVMDVFFCIFRTFISAASLGRKTKEEKKPGFPFVGLCIINTVSKKHIQRHRVERGMANLLLWEWLDWPGSYEFQIYTLLDTLIAEAGSTTEIHLLILVYDSLMAQATVLKLCWDGRCCRKNCTEIVHAVTVNSTTVVVLTYLIVHAVAM